MLIVFVVAGAFAAGWLLIRLLAGAPADSRAGGQRSRRALSGMALGAVVALSVVGAARSAGLSIAASQSEPRLLWATGHAGAVGLWLGAWMSLALISRAAVAPATELSGRRAARTIRAASLCSLFLAMVMATAAGVARTLDGWPALVGTRSGRLLLAQFALVVSASGLAVAARRRLRAATGAPERARMILAARWLGISAVVGSTMAVAGIALAGLAAEAPETTVWPFRVRLAPAVMLRFPGAQDQVITGAVIAIGGVLATVAAVRVRAWRPLLLLAGSLLLVTGCYQTLGAMTIDAYPTTYARPPAGGMAESSLRGRDLFATRCAPCHGSAGLGDGRAAAGLVQRPADLTAAHTADHTPGDLYWWITHGLGLAMPAFGEQLSVTERWDLVNFVRTLSVTRGPVRSGRPSG